MQNQYDDFLSAAWERLKKEPKPAKTDLFSIRIELMKLLMKEKGLGLKQAKDIADDFIARQMPTEQG